MLSQKDIAINEAAYLEQRLFQLRVRFDSCCEMNHQHFINAVRQKKLQQEFQNRTYIQAELLEKEIEIFFSNIKKNNRNFANKEEEYKCLNEKMKLLSRAVSKTDMFFADMFSRLFEDPVRETQAVEKCLDAFEQLNGKKETSS